MTPRGDGILVDVFDGDRKSVDDAESGVYGSESALTQHVTHPVRLRERFAVYQRQRVAT